MVFKITLPYISKDVSTSGVPTKEEAIFRAQKLDLISTQYGILYEIILGVPRYNLYFTKLNIGPRNNVIVGSVQSPTMESLEKKIHEISMKQYAVEAANAGTPSP